MTKIKFLINFFKTQKGIALSLLFFAIVFNAVFLWPELTISNFSLNDEVLHLSSVQQAVSVLKAGQDPTDFWLPQIGLGFPFFEYYQHFPQLVLTIIKFIFSSASLFFLFNISRYLLLVLFPLSIFLAMRRMEFDYLAAGIGAFISSLLSTEALYGLDYGSYIWRGSGLYTQLWAMFFLPLALAEIYRVVLNKKGNLILAVSLSTFVFLSNLIYGYILVLSSILFVFLQLKKEEILFRLKKLILIFILLGFATSYFWIPFLLDKTYLNRSIWEAALKYDSYGAVTVLSNLFLGKLFDFNRLPSLTVLFFLAVVCIIALKCFKQENYRFLLIFTVVWLLLYFGRPFWDGLLNILPFSRNLHLHRFIGGFHLGAIMVIGAGIFCIFQFLKKFSLKFSILFFILLLIIISPAIIERVKFYRENTIWKIESQKAFLSNQKEISEIEQTLKNLPPGRVYAGLPSTWGGTYYYKIGFVNIYDIFPQLGFDSFGYSYYSLAFSDDIRLHFDDTKIFQYSLFNIRYVLLHKTWTSAYYYQKIKEFDNYILYEVPTTGYFDLVDAPAVFYGKKDDFYYPNAKWLFSQLPELKQHPIIEIGENPKKTFGLPVFPFLKVDENTLAELAKTQNEKGVILGEKTGINKYWAQFGVYEDSFLMLKTNYHPRWNVYLDYEKVSPVMLAPGFIGIKVSPGIHQALFLYKSPPYRIILLIFTILVLVSYFLIKKFQKKNF